MNNFAVEADIVYSGAYEASYRIAFVYHVFRAI